ncbi:universal stress protein [Ketobacter sp. MCCC 1A13808]|uniref:universal stress protein n=1 Tax=Ketobacter sp. MCCC 1A13808 TaxID=2602738 RepID=UPI000F26BCEC|nr:universal stress protein [Ketobacter sp. MCCC 1A13808]MVF12704.1 universal stress protein [Ketobacter sp. MCCC 1A13808]RLP55502.1 MAG: universal stress protein [Ketobacter sp.]
MSQYSHILLAADFNQESEDVSARAAALKDTFSATLSIIHVLEPISIAYGGEFPVDLGDLHKELEKQAESQLKELGAQLGVPPERQYLEVGITEKEILRVGKEKHVDLIVMGSHGRHGLALLLGSTANAVLHHAEIDVLAVRIKKSK